MDEFEQFWAAFPRKIGKGDARKSWMRSAKIRPPLAALLQAIKNALSSEQWQRDGGRYICHPSTWLNQERWADEHDVNLEDAKEWYETSHGIEAKGAELGIDQRNFAHFPAFKAAVMQASRVQPITQKARG